MDSSSSPDSTRKTVMICDDEDDLVKVYSNYLKRKFNIITADSGEACLSTYRVQKEKGRKVDVLLLDYRLGDMLGDKVACQIKELDGTKTILITAYEIDENTLADLKTRDCITLSVKKPISLTVLLQRIQEVLKDSKDSAR